MSAFGPKRTSLVAPHMSAFRGKADMTIWACLLLRSLLGVKRTWVGALHMSAIDPKRTCPSALQMSAFGGKADMTCLLLSRAAQIFGDVEAVIVVTVRRGSHN